MTTELHSRISDIFTTDIFFSDIPVWKKYALTFEEAATYTNVGVHSLRDLAKNENVSFVLKVGTKTLLKRKQLMEYLDGLKEL